MNFLDNSWCSYFVQVENDIVLSSQLEVHSPMAIIGRPGKDGRHPEISIGIRCQPVIISLAPTILQGIDLSGCSRYSPESSDVTSLLNLFDVPHHSLNMLECSFCNGSDSLCAAVSRPWHFQVLSGYVDSFPFMVILIQSH